jgi:hypothetical protein
MKVNVDELLTNKPLGDPLLHLMKIRQRELVLGADFGLEPVLVIVVLGKPKGA